MPTKFKPTIVKRHADGIDRSPHMPKKSPFVDSEDRNPLKYDGKDHPYKDLFLSVLGFGMAHSNVPRQDS